MELLPEATMEVHAVKMQRAMYMDWMELEQCRGLIQNCCKIVAQRGKLWERPWLRSGKVWIMLQYQYGDWADLLEVLHNLWWLYYPRQHQSPYLLSGLQNLRGDSQRLYRGAGESVWLCFLKSLICHINRWGLPVSSSSLVNSFKSFPQVPRAVKIVSWDHIVFQILQSQSVKYLQVTQEKQGKKVSHFLRCNSHFVSIKHFIKTQILKLP